jgi:hypothetical protein
MRVLTAVLVLFAATAQAEELGAGLKKCAAISDSLQRLVCYDKLAKRAEGLSAETAAPQPVVSGFSDTQRPRREAVSVRCQATTKKGTQCKRNAKPGSSYCWQHGG